MLPLAFAALACSASTLLAAAAADPTPNTLTPDEAKAGWVLLFDGKDPAAHLRGYKKEAMPKEWVVEGDSLVLHGSGGDLVTKDQYQDFEFQTDWKISSGGNSGIMWRVTEDHTYPWETGLEMQVLDDTKHPDGKSRKTSAGACYALFPAPEGVVKPVGEWNTARIVAIGPKVTYFLNGKQTAEFDMSSPEFKETIKASKFATMPDFGTRAKGHIALQDHGDVVMYRNIKVRPIATVAGTTKSAPKGAPESGSKSTPKPGTGTGPGTGTTAPAKPAAPTGTAK